MDSSEGADLGERVVILALEQAAQLGQVGDELPPALILAHEGRQLAGAALGALLQHGRHAAQIVGARRLERVLQGRARHLDAGEDVADVVEHVDRDLGHAGVVRAGDGAPLLLLERVVHGLAVEGDGEQRTRVVHHLATRRRGVLDSAHRGEDPPVARFVAHRHDEGDLAGGAVSEGQQPERRKRAHRHRFAQARRRIAIGPVLAGNLDFGVGADRERSSGGAGVRPSRFVRPQAQTPAQRGRASQPAQPPRIALLGAEQLDAELVLGVQRHL